MSPINLVAWSAGLLGTIAQAAPYSGELLDAHVHHDLPYLTVLKQRMAEHQVVKAVVFSHLDPKRVQASERKLEQQGAFSPEVLNFFHVDPKRPEDMQRRQLDLVSKQVLHPFWGIGELGLYRDPWRQTSLSAPVFHDVFSFARDQHLTLMLHLRVDQLHELEPKLREFPNVTILIHGSDHDPRLVRLLEQYSNLYVSFDMGGAMRVKGIPILFPHTGGKDSFIANYHQHYQEMLDAASTRLASLVKAAPHRIFWGTDVALDWHVDADVYQRIVLFGRDLIGTLPEELRHFYAQENARRLWLRSSFRPSTPHP